MSSIKSKSTIAEKKSIKNNDTKTKNERQYIGPADEEANKIEWRKKKEIESRRKWKESWADNGPWKEIYCKWLDSGISRDLRKPSQTSLQWALYKTKLLQNEKNNNNNSNSCKIYIPNAFRNKAEEEEEERAAHLNAFKYQTKRRPITQNGFCNDNDNDFANCISNGNNNNNNYNTSGSGEDEKCKKYNNNNTNPLPQQQQQGNKTTNWPKTTYGEVGWLLSLNRKYAEKYCHVDSLFGQIKLNQKPPLPWFIPKITNY